MKSEITGITRANEGMQGISWNILGQTYVPKNCTDHCFSWHATMPPGTFVPPHIHPDQDEYLYMLEGKLDFMLGGADAQATAGDLIRLGMGVQHGIYCLGCCWALMLLMFVVGTGSVGWMLALGAIMAIEKNMPWGRRLSAPLGFALLTWAAATVIGNVGFFSG